MSGCRCAGLARVCLMVTKIKKERKEERTEAKHEGLPTYVVLS